MFEKSELLKAEDGGDLHEGTVTTNGTSSQKLIRQDSGLTALMDDQPDEDYW